MTEHAVKIGNRRLCAGEPAMIVAELSGNHNGDYDRAVALVHAAAEAGADAVKLQTYTADTLTIDCDKEYFRLNRGITGDHPGGASHRLLCYARQRRK